MSEPYQKYRAGQPKEEIKSYDEWLIFDYVSRFWPREKIIKFALSLIGEEARAWWARKQMNQS